MLNLNQQYLQLSEPDPNEPILYQGTNYSIFVQLVQRAANIPPPQPQSQQGRRHNQAKQPKQPVILPTIMQQLYFLILKDGIIKL